MPHGATPSRWCVCQFHHFRTARVDLGRGDLIIAKARRTTLLVLYDRREGFRIEAGATHQRSVNLLF